MDQLKKLFNSLSLKQRISLGGVALAVIAGLFFLSRWNTERDFKPLYSGLSQEDAAAVLAKVRESGTDYRLGENGTVVLVPSEKVAELRLQLASAGVPKSGRIGFELFDKTNFGASDFTEQVNYHRALEGELERSVMALTEVEQAHVHITFPKDSVFIESRQPAKASVLVKLRPGSRLSPQNVAAICQLMASAVEGLQADAVSVVDSEGNLLNRPHKALSPDSPEPDDALLEYRQKIERDLTSKINTTLEPLLGDDKFRAGVSVDCDFSSGDQSEETFDPTKSVMVNSQKTEDISGPNTASGAPGTASNLPRPTSRPGTSGSSVMRRTENIGYQSSRTIRHTRLPQGTIRRVSVSILLDNSVHFAGVGPNAKRILEPVPPERIKAIHDLVAGAIGFSAERGDQLVIESLPFESTLSATPPTAPSSVPAPKAPWFEQLLKNRLYLGIGAGLVLLLVLAMGLFFVAIRRKQAHRTIQVQAQIADVKKDVAASTEEMSKKFEAQLAEQASTRQRQEMEALHALKLPPVQTKKAEVLTKHIHEEAKKDPKIMAQIVRTWLGESSAR